MRSLLLGDTLDDRRSSLIRDFIRNKREKLAAEMTHERPIASERPLRGLLDSAYGVMEKNATDPKAALYNTLGGGLLDTASMVNQVVGNMPAYQKAALVASPIPIVGDIAGLAADAKYMYDNPEERTVGNGLLAAAGLLPVIPGMTVFHGSPHKWDKVDLSKVGTGEGAQAYGHGFYVAENPEVAKMYQAQMKPPDDLIDIRVGGVQLYQRGSPVDYGPRSNAAEEYAKAVLQENALIEEWPLREAFAKDGENGLLKEFGRILDETMEYAAEEVPEYLPYLKGVKYKLDHGIGNRVNIKKGVSHLYELDLPDETVDKMLDWDAPLSEQPESVRKVLRELGVGGDNPQPLSYDELVANGLTPGEARLAAEEFKRMSEYDPTGREIYKALSEEKLSQEEASEYLNSLGIPGIKYWDGSSRSAGEGTRNFVVFSEDTIKPLKRNDDPIGGLLDVANKSELRNIKAGEDFLPHADDPRYVELAKEYYKRQGITVNPDNTITMYHASSPDRIARIKEAKEFYGGATTAAGGRAYGPSAFFYSNKDNPWRSGGMEQIEVDVPVQYVKHPPGNLNEFFFEGGLYNDNGVWKPRILDSDYFNRLLVKRMLLK